MIGIVYSKLDVVGANMASRIIETHELEKIEDHKYLRYETDELRIYEVDVLPFMADFADEFGCDALVFLSRHKSEAAVDAFTTHSLGNWRGSADFGGKPKQLSWAASSLMLAVLKRISAIDKQVEKTFEATHHGPLLKTPCLFAESGGSDSMIESSAAAALVADATMGAITDAIDGDAIPQKTAIGIGSNHYPEKFSGLALSKGYAFTHIMPKYAILNEDGTDNLDVLAQTLERSDIEPETAVIDWKSLNATMKEQTIKKLNEIGLDNEKV
ncbi:MAG: hypothetical protein M1286_01990 [Candidatus Marsarchaeota archaeon]|nr:hypothetical protein [Candidatus Marsarchaeota archaeon]